LAALAINDETLRELLAASVTVDIPDQTVIAIAHNAGTAHQIFHGAGNARKEITSTTTVTPITRIEPIIGECVWPTGISKAYTNRCSLQLKTDDLYWTVFYTIDRHKFLNRSRSLHEETATACDFIAAITQHIPDKRFQMVRYYG